MQVLGGGLANLTQIPVRLHSSLQSLSANDHPQYFCTADVFANRPAASTNGAFYFATDTLALYRDNGSSWVRVSIDPAQTDLSALKTSAFLNLSDTFASYSGKGTYILRVNAGATALEAVVLPAPTAVYYIGSATYFNDGGSYVDTSRHGTPQLMRTLTFPAGYPTTTTRMSFQLRDNDAAGKTVHGRWYKNGSPFGTDQSTSNASYQTFDEDLSVSAGDAMALYIWSASAGQGQAAATNLLLKGSVTIPSWTITGS